jgi:hypothetical protein
MPGTFGCQLCRLLKQDESDKAAGANQTKRKTEKEIIRCSPGKSD